MKATEKKSAIDNLGYQVARGFNPQTKKDFIWVTKMNTKNGTTLFEKRFATIHTAYKSLCL